MSASHGHEEAAGQVQYAYLANLGMGLPEQLLAQGMLVQPGPQLVPAGQYKNCNCKKAKCLKLYCVCFQAGVYCNGCSCTDCLNLQVNDELITRERNRILQREGPQAFGRKNAIQAAGVHLKGCRCSRSKCAKKYCECFDYQVPCSELCKCKDCKNPKNKDIGMPRFAVTAAQQQQLLMAMQQKQLGGADVMNVDAAGLLQMEMLQQQQQQQAQMRLEDLCKVGCASGQVSGSQPGSRSASQPNSRPASPGPAQQPSMQFRTLQQSAGWPPAIQPPVGPAVEHAGAASGAGLGALQPLLPMSAPQQTFSLAEVAAAAALARSHNAPAGAAGGASRSAKQEDPSQEAAGLQLLQQYGHWLQVQMSTAMPSEEGTQHPGALAQGQQTTAEATTQMDDSDRQHRSASQQPLLADEAPLDVSQPNSRQNSREPSVGPGSMKPVAINNPAPAAADATQNSQLPSQAAAAEVGMQEVQHDVPVLVTGGNTETDQPTTAASQDAATTSITVTPSVRSVGPGKGVQSDMLQLDGILITKAAAQRPSAAAASDTQQMSAPALTASAEAQRPQQQQQVAQQQHQVHDDVSATAAKAPIGQPMAAVKDWYMANGPAAAAAAAVQQQLLTAVGSYMSQMPYVNGAAPSPAWLLNSTMQHQYHPAAYAQQAALLPVAGLQGPASRLQSNALLAVAAQHADRMNLCSAADPSGYDNAAVKAAVDDGKEQSCGLFTAASLLGDTESAAELARAIGLDETAADAARQAAEFLQLLLKLHNESADTVTMPSNLVDQQQDLLHKLKLGQSSLELYGSRHLSTPLLAGTGGPQVAVLTDRPLAAVQAATAAGSKLSPALQALHRQQSAASPMSATAAAACATSGVLPQLHAHVKAVGGIASTPSPITAHMHRQAGSLRGPSPLGPVNHNNSGRECGLQALLGPGKQHLLQQQQQQQGTPVSMPAAPPAAPGSGTSSAVGSARRSKQLRPGSFRIGASNNSPAVSHDSVAHTADNPAQAAALNHVAGLRGTYQHMDSPAGSISLAPSNASVGHIEQDPAAAAAAIVDEGQTPVFRNRLKDGLRQQQEQQAQGHLDQEVQGQLQAHPLGASEAAAAAVAGVSPVISFRAAGAAAAAGAHTPLTECEVAAEMAAAAARMVSAATPATWQSQGGQGSLSERPGSEMDPVAAILGSFNGQPWSGMTPAGMDFSFGNVRSVLAGLTSPFDPASFLSSPLPHMTSVLREAASGSTTGLRALGLKLHEITPVLLNLQNHARAASTGGSSGARRRGAAAKGTNGVKALCAGWGEAKASGAAAAVEAAADGGHAAAAGDAAAAGPLGQVDAPASGMKLDTDKAAARAAAAAGDGGHEGLMHAAGDSDAGINSLIAAVNFITTPGYGDEMPTKRRRHNAGPEASQEQGATMTQQQQQHRKPVALSAASRWAAFQELDTRHTADGADDHGSTAAVGAPVFSQDADIGLKTSGFTAQPRRVLLPAAAADAGARQQTQIPLSQSDTEQQYGIEWGSQLATASLQQQEQDSGQQQQVNLNMESGCSLLISQTSDVGVTSTQKQSQQASQHRLRFAQKDACKGPAAKAAAELAKQQETVCSGVQQGVHLPDLMGAEDHGNDAHLQPTACNQQGSAPQDMFIMSPPANTAAKLGALTPAKGAAERSPSIDYREYADAMLQLSRAL